VLATHDIGSGNTGVHVRDTTTGLFQATPYHFRVVATNSGGTVTGSDHMFTTGTPQPLVGPEGAIVTSSTSVTLQGWVNPQGFPISWYFEYGTSQAYGSRSQVQDLGSWTWAIGVSAELTNLSSSVPYHWRLAAVNAGGMSVTPDSIFIIPTHDVSFPIGTGSTWTYMYKGSNYITGAAIEYVSGIHTWRVLSSAVRVDSVVYTLSDAYLDTLSWNPQIHPDSLVSGSDNSTISVSRSAIYFYSREISGVSIPRFVVTSNDTITVSSPGIPSYELVWVWEEGLIRYKGSFSFHGINWTADLSLISQKIQKR
jgi:hypothetical protein